MPSIIEELIDKLRTCQRDAIRTAQNFLKNYQDKSCLICLPTGAGKSGVIAIITQECTSERALVISHRRAVCDQLKSEISGKFFDKLKNNHSFTLKKVYELAENAEKPGIYITTFQKLAILDKENLKI